MPGRIKILYTLEQLTELISGAYRRTSGRDSGGRGSKRLGAVPLQTPADIARAGLPAAAVALARGDFDAALTAYGRILDVDPEIAEAHFGWGVSAVHVGRDREAMVSFRRAFELNPRFAEAGLKWADMLRAMDDDAAALDIYRRILEVDPVVAEAHYGWGAAAFRLGRDAEAELSFRRALEIKPEFAEAGLRLAEVLGKRGQDFAALDLYRRVLESHPDLPEAHYGCGTTALRLGRDAEAELSFRRAVEITPDFAVAGLRLAELVARRGDVSAALDLYRRVVESHPDFAEAHYGCGTMALRLGRDRDAMAAFRRAFETNANYSEAGLRWADLALAEGENAVARDVYRRVLALAPDIAEAHYGCGATALEVGDLIEANAAFHRALVLNPNYPAAYVAAAFLSLFPEHAVERRARSDRAIVCVPILPYARDWLGGQIYLLNFARTVSSLPRRCRPRLIVAVLVEDWRDVDGLRQLVQELAACAAVLGVFGHARRPITMKPALEGYARRKACMSAAPVDWASDLFAGVDWTFPILYPSWGAGPVRGPLYWIPDLQHKFLPSNFSSSELMSRNRDMTALAVRPVPIVFSSHDACAHFRRFYPRQRGRAYAWHFCTLFNEHLAAATSDDYAALGLPHRFYYTPNQFWPHKDHVTLFKALRHILDAGHDVTFVCTGSDLNRDTSDYARSLLRLIDDLALGANLRLVGVLPRDVQLEIMRRACAIIQPSLFEGWSTVIEDARAFGRPLIVSDLPVHREQLGKDAVFFTPQDAVALASAVIAIDATASPGPDADRENAIRPRQLDRIHSSARQFVDILRAEKTLSN